MCIMNEFANRERPMATVKTTNYWLFQYQAADEQGREIDKAQSGDRIGWLRWPFGTEVKPGDVAFLWRSAGTDAGLKGWAVIEEAEPSSKAGSRLRIRVDVTLDQTIA